MILKFRVNINQESVAGISFMLTLKFEAEGARKVTPGMAGLR